ncbi:hypothetical protein A8990_107189 [Paenibacillus taihuensis]|uniref:LysM domain-containing protein n=1 Tax=Paenibacillus taihuensis TaxID=1156355 RepID=A0A3D9SDJ9_9BACL|nr:hypothetical protein [Paenibacillus taihuensis]REE89091.1 hypothetical protein A8990_107189 [Paenibacillus taihuensis]
MKRNWKLAGAALLIAIAVPVTAYAAADNLNGKSAQEKKIAAQKTIQAGEQGQKARQDAGDYNLLAAFTLLGIDKAEFAKQVQAGKSFADIAKDHGVTRQQLIDALVSDINAKIDALKAKGTITAQQATQKKQAVLKEVGDFVDHTQTMFAKKESMAAAEGKDKGINVDSYVIATTKLGLDKAGFQQAVEDGKSLADIAKEKGIELQPLIDAQTAEIVKAIQSKLGDKTLTAEEQENVKKKASMEAERIFTAPLNKEDEKERGGGGYNMQAALELIGIDKATFAEQVQGGKSFADIAKDHGVTRQQLIDALMSDVNAKLAEVQANGDATAEQVDQKKQAALKEVEDFVDHTSSMFEMKEKKVQVDKKAQEEKK